MQKISSNAWWWSVGREQARRALPDHDRVQEQVQHIEETLAEEPARTNG
jgi:hypothetical protein